MGTGDGRGTAAGTALPGTPSRRTELLVFLATTFVIIPGLTVGFVGAYGLVVWIAQMVFGPPGPPS